MTTAEKLLEAEEADELIGIFGYDHINPKDFVKLEADLFATVTPEWRDAQAAAREAAPEPPPVAPNPPREPNQSVCECRGRPPLRLRQVMAAAATLARPGEELPLKRIAEASGIPLRTVIAVTRPARSNGSWPYTGLRTKDRRKSHAGTVPPSR
jgi:hypothetical protein